MIHLKVNNQYDWDTILHEFGHYAADKEQFTDYWPAEHSFTQNQNDVHGKWIGPMLSWSEGFATYFAMIAQETTSLKTVSPRIPQTSDMIYSSIQIETDTKYLWGEGSETVIARLLWDFQDGGGNEIWDTVNWGHIGLWNKLQNAAPWLTPLQNLSGFLDLIDTSYANEGLGNLLSYYKISPKLLDDGYFDRDVKYTFRWEAGGGSDKYPNNDFKLNIMKPNGQLIFSKNVGNVTSYTPTNTEWQTILNTNVKTIRWNVTAFQKDFWGDSGPFLSDTKTIAYRNTESQYISAADFDTVFENPNQQGQYFFYEKTADVQLDNGYQFSTKRLRCSYIENEFLVLSPKRSGAGTAYLEFDFGTDINNIEFDISMWSASEGVSDNDTTIKLQYKDTNGNWVTSRQFSINSMSKDRLAMNHYSIDLLNGYNFGIRFITETIIPIGSSNKGRVVLNNITINY
ncbi:MAG: hypothetical protein LBR37_01330 [Erysipelotrichaceae bacterium]|jgi:hypothetical protein|nr:hypothetical protein [Erysipelotrichaceae bacterium]